MKIYDSDYNKYHDIMVGIDNNNKHGQPQFKSQ